MQTFDSFSFGCRVNQAEKEQLDRELVNLGLQRSADQPDLYVINSCAVTHKAEREAKQRIYQIRRKFPSAKIVVTGCAATNWIKLNLNVPAVDLLVDNANKEFLAKLLLKRLHIRKVPSSQQVPEGDNEIVRKKAHIAKINSDKYLASKRAIIKIQDGCQRFCTFCIVPYLRGLPKSTSINTLIQDILSFGPDLKEIILTAINTEAYGYDTKETFLDLLKTVLTKTDLPRISFGSIHPWSINEKFFNFYRNYPGADRIVNFFHIPLQSGSNKVLTLMKRDYKREEFIEKLDILTKIKPFTFIGTDVIVGFLEEEDSDFQDTYNFLKNSPVSKFHVFRFSQRSHTAAFYMAKRLREPSPEKKHARAKALIDLSKQKYDRFIKTHIGHSFEALFLEKREGDYHHVTLSNQIPAVIKSEKYFTGEIKKVQIDGYKNDRLFGTIV